MSLEFTLVRRAISLAVIDGPDTDDNPDILKAQGSVLFEPVIKKGDSIQVQTRGGSETYALAPIECPINDGIISHRGQDGVKLPDRKSTRLNSSHPTTSRMPSSA